MKRILFLCDGNACRSQLAAAALKRLHPDWDVMSAGWSPRIAATEIHWKTRAIAWEIGLELDGKPKHWSIYASQRFDEVVAFSLAAAQDVPWAAELVPIADPTPEGNLAQFAATRDAILGFVAARWGTR